MAFEDSLRNVMGTIAMTFNPEVGMGMLKQQEQKKAAAIKGLTESVQTGAMSPEQAYQVAQEQGIPLPQGIGPTAATREQQQLASARQATAESQGLVAGYGDQLRPQAAVQPPAQPMAGQPVSIQQPIQQSQQPQAQPQEPVVETYSSISQKIKQQYPQASDAAIKQAADTLLKEQQAQQKDVLATKRAETAAQTPVMKEAEALYGKGTPKYKAALEAHLKRIDTLPPSAQPVDPDKVERTAQSIAALGMPPYTGSMLRNPFAQAAMDRVLEINPEYRSTDFNNQKLGEARFTSGPQGNAIRSISVARNHMETLQELADAMKNNDTVAFNKVRNIWREQTGSELPTNMRSAANIVGQEVVKGVVGSQATGEERAAAARAFSEAASPEQLKGAITTVDSLLKGQVSGLKKQWETFSKKDFNKTFGFAAKPVTGAATEYSDVEKERRYQEWKAKHAK